jgi:hypothetical protein
VVWYTLLRARDLPVLAEDALAVDTLVLPVDLEVGAEGTQVVAAGSLLLAMDADLLSVDTQVLPKVWVQWLAAGYIFISSAYFSKALLLNTCMAVW